MNAVLAGLGAVIEILVVVGLLVGLAGVACSTVEYLEPSGDTSACERAAPAGTECAVVYQCVSGIELCIRSEDLSLAEHENGHCWPSKDERFSAYAALSISPPCFWCCDGDCPRGANAKNGSYCGGVTP